MTLTTTTSRVSYPGTGGTGPFAYLFKILSPDDLLITKLSVTGAETTLIYIDDYSVGGVRNETGNITLVSPLVAGETLTIRRVMHVTQDTSIRNQGANFPAMIEDQFDRLVMIDQQHQDAIGRSLRLSESFDPALVDMVIRELTAGKVLTGTGSGLTMAALDSTAIALPGEGRTVATVSAYLANNSVINVEDYGADPTGNIVADSAFALAQEAAGLSKLLYLRSGAIFKMAGTFTIKGPVMASGARINYSGSGIAVQVGDGTAFIQQAQLDLPSVSQTRKVGLGWSLSDTGVKIIRCFKCFITVPYVSGFSVGLLEYGKGQGCDYNCIRIGHLYNNKVNHQLDGDATGWVNENNHWGGRMSHDPAELQGRHTTITGQPGVRQIQILKPASQTLNNHRWYGTSLEGDVPELHVECKGQSNLWDWCRWEAAHPKVRFDGAGAIDNYLRGGYDLHVVDVTYANGARSARSDDRDAIRWAPAGGDGVIIAAPANSSATPVIVGLDAGKDPQAFTSASKDWSFKLAAQFLKAKLATDASPRMTLDFTNGHGDFALLSVGGTSAATTPGPVVRKLPIYDANLNLLGYIPIYRSIT